MTRTRKKIITTSVLFLGVAVVVAAGITLYPSLRERYWIWKLREAEDPVERIAAIERLGELRSERAVPVLIDEMKQGRTPSAGPLVTAFSSIGPKAVDPLAEVVKDRAVHEVIRRWAIDALDGIGPEAKSAAEELIAISGEQDFPFRFFAIMALAKVDPTSPRTVEVLRDLSTDRDPQVRDAAEEALKYVEAKKQKP